MVAYKSLIKDKGKVQWGNPKSGRGRLRDLFEKVVVTRAGRLQEQSQGKLRLHR